MQVSAIEFAHIAERSRKSLIYTNLCVLFINGDLFGRTNHTNIMIEFVKIRATDKVAIIETQCYSCKFVRFVDNKKYLWAKNIKLVDNKKYSVENLFFLPKTICWH